MKHLKDYLLIILLVLIVVYGKQTLQSSKEALMLWFEKLVPSMFVTLVFIRILYHQHIIDHIRIPCLPSVFGMNEEAFSFVIALMFLGFPNGALLIDEALAHKRIQQVAARRLLYTCSFPAPGFVVLTCGAMLFHSIYIGIILFIVQIVSGFILLLCTRKTTIVMKKRDALERPPLIKSISHAIWESGKALYIIGGYLMLFMSIVNVVFQFIPYQISLPFRILSEFSSGTLLIQTLPYNTWILQLITCMLLGFGGFCVHMQVISMSEQIQPTYYKYLFFRIIQSLLSVVLLYVIMIQ